MSVHVIPKIEYLRLRCVKKETKTMHAQTNTDISYSNHGNYVPSMTTLSIEWFHGQGNKVRYLLWGNKDFSHLCFKSVHINAHCIV